MKNIQQQLFLQQVRMVHTYVLRTLQETAPKSWEGHELKEYAYENCPVTVVAAAAATSSSDDGDGTTMMILLKSVMSKDIFYKRLWPKVVFESRTDVNVEKNILIRSGNLVDVWTWKQQPPPPPKKSS